MKGSQHSVWLLLPVHKKEYNVVFFYGKFYSHYSMQNITLEFYINKKRREVQQFTKESVTCGNTFKVKYTQKLVSAINKDFVLLEGFSVGVYLENDL